MVAAAGLSSVRSVGVIPGPGGAVSLSIVWPGISSLCAGQGAGSACLSMPGRGSSPAD